MLKVINLDILFVFCCSTNLQERFEVFGNESMENTIALKPSKSKEDTKNANYVFLKLNPFKMNIPKKRKILIMLSAPIKLNMLCFKSHLLVYKSQIS